MLVTTVVAATREVERRARGLAKECSAAYVARATNTLTQLLHRYRAEEIFIVGERELRYKHIAGDVIGFHPSMAMIRLKRLLRGERDAMLEAAQIAPGDRVIDCTMGLASDAIVFAAAVGSLGSVTALESERTLYLLVKDGLQHYECGFPELEAAMRRVNPILTDHLTFLRQQPDNSADVVYFDPMFRQAHESSAIDPLRRFANARALSEETIAEALRVARKTVVMKEHNRSGEFERLGFRPLSQAYPKITYGVRAR